MQCACAVSSSVVCHGLTVFFFFILSHKRNDFRKKILNIKYVLIFYIDLKHFSFYEEFRER